MSLNIVQVNYQQPQIAILINISIVFSALECKLPKRLKLSDQILNLILSINQILLLQVNHLIL